MREVAAFRHPYLIALQGIEQQLAIDALKRLLDEQSLETRYGAFCSIRRRVDGTSIVRGRKMETFRIYEMPSKAPAAVVVSLREQPEIVLMGSLQPLNIPEYLMLPGGIMIKRDTERADHYRVLRFQPGKDDQRAVVPNTIAAVAAGITAVGGRYGDVIAMLRTAKDEGHLVDQLAIDPVPEPIRMYYREEDEGASGKGASGKGASDEGTSSEGTSNDGPALDLGNPEIEAEEAV